MSLRVQELAEAAAEFDAAVEWYEARWTLLATRFVDVVEAGIADI